jgi:hypothetical protein
VGELERGQREIGRVLTTGIMGAVLAGGQEGILARSGLGPPLTKGLVAMFAGEEDWG